MKAAGHSSLSPERCAGDSPVVLKSVGLDRVQTRGGPHGTPALEGQPQRTILETGEEQPGKRIQRRKRAVGELRGTVL